MVSGYGSRHTVCRNREGIGADGISIEMNEDDKAALYMHADGYVADLARMRGATLLRCTRRLRHS
jgi:hypothetical protein